MGSIKIINNSTLTEYAALLSIGMLMAGTETDQERAERGISIKKKGTTFTVMDIGRD